MAEADQAAMELPAPYVNQFQVLVAGAVVRLSFAEGFAGQPSNYRSAVTLSVHDAQELAMAILRSVPVPNPLAAGLAGANYPGSLLSEEIYQSPNRNALLGMTGRTAPKKP